MQLQYLDFEFADEESGRGSFDAMASVLPESLPALLAELRAVLTWAVGAFGPVHADDGDGDSDWDYELQGIAEPATLLAIDFDAVSGTIVLVPAGGKSRKTLTLTLSGSPAFCEAFQARFEVDV